jgi:hypothetical protein
LTSEAENDRYEGWLEKDLRWKTLKMY